MNCKVCEKSITFNVFMRSPKSYIAKDEGFPIITSPLAAPQISYIECNTCGATVFGIEAHPQWYPYLKVDQDRWNNQGKSNSPRSDLEQAVTKLSVSDMAKLVELLTKQKEKE